jgi:hypothetical protein
MDEVEVEDSPHRPSRNVRGLLLQLCLGLQTENRGLITRFPSFQYQGSMAFTS